MALALFRTVFNDPGLSPCGCLPGPKADTRRAASRIPCGPSKQSPVTLPSRFGAITHLTRQPRTGLSLCLHALSSFQRTGYSITPASHHWPPPRVLDPHRAALTPSSGEPYEITLTFHILSSHCALHRCIATRLTTRAAPVTDKRCWGEV